MPKRHFFVAVVALSALLAVSVPASATGAPSGFSVTAVSDAGLRAAVRDAGPTGQVNLIVPADVVPMLSELGFTVGAAVGSLPFVTVSGTGMQVVEADRLGLTSGMVVNGLVPAPAPVATQRQGGPEEAFDAGHVTGATRLHERGITGKGEAVAIVDTGVQASHPYLRDSEGRSRVVAEGCFVSRRWLTDGDFPCPGGGDTAFGPGAADSGTDARFAHGTHVAGIAAGDARQAPGAGGWTGVAPEANLGVARVFGSWGAGMSDIVAGLDWVATNAAQYRIASVNLSLAAFAPRYFDCSDIGQTVYGAVLDRLHAAGVRVVAASGNDGALGGLGVPACAPGVVSVGATDDQGRVAVFSNVSEELDLLAPGVNIWSSLPVDDFVAWSGTSMATPMVAGAFALLRQGAPGRSEESELAALRSVGPLVDDVLVKGLPTLRVDMALAQLTGSGDTVPVAPDPPTDVTVDPLGKAVQVTWNPPAYDGGSPITGYTVIASPGGRKCFEPVVGTSCKIWPLPVGGTFTVTVQAKNAYGSSHDSAPSSAFASYKPPPRPGAVLNLRAYSVKSAIRVTWSQIPETAGFPVTYRYQRDDRPGYLSTSGTTIRVRGKKGVPIRVTVWAVNGGPPGPPQTVTAAPH